MGLEADMSDEMNVESRGAETSGSLQKPRGSAWRSVVVVVALVAGLGALGLSVFNTVRFDDRVHDFVSAHRAELAGERGAPGSIGATGVPGPAGPIGLPGKAGASDLGRYNVCLAYEIESWAQQLTVDTGALGSRVSTVGANLAIACQP
jgi:hypothetical protein